MGVCTHPRIEIYEYSDWESAHFRISKDNWFHNHEPISYKAKIRVKCPDCKIDRDYNKYKPPKWLGELLLEMRRGDEI